MSPQEPKCPQCDGELLRGEDNHGVTWQCTDHSCLALFDDDEITEPSSITGDKQ